MVVSDTSTVGILGKIQRDGPIPHVDTEAYLKSRRLTLLNTTCLGRGFPSRLDGNYCLPIPTIVVNPCHSLQYNYEQAVGKRGCQVKYQIVGVMRYITCNVDLCPKIFSDFRGHKKVAHFMEITSKL